jgi:hypothetical protein
MHVAELKVREIMVPWMAGASSFWLAPPRRFAGEVGEVAEDTTDTHTRTPPLCRPYNALVPLGSLVEETATATPNANGDMNPPN